MTPNQRKARKKRARVNATGLSTLGEGLAPPLRTVTGAAQRKWAKRVRRAARKSERDEARAASVAEVIRFPLRTPILSGPLPGTVPDPDGKSAETRTPEVVKESPGLPPDWVPGESRRARRRRALDAAGRYVRRLP